MAFVSGIVHRRLAPGQLLVIEGGFFNGGCSVYVGRRECEIADYDDDKIEAIAPINLGSYDVKVVDDSGKEINAGKVSILELADTPRRFFPKEYTKNDFISHIHGLLPRGNSISLWSGSNFGKLFSAIADAFKYVWDTIRQMHDAIDPTHTENYNEWERELNLPVVGINPQTYAERLKEIYRVECCDGGCSKNYIKSILSLMDIKADVYEYTNISESSHFSSYEFEDDDVPSFFFKVEFHVESSNFIKFCAGLSCAGDYLLDFNQYREESVIESIKPAHTKVIYGYVDATKDGELILSDGRAIVTSTGKSLTFDIE